MTAEEKLKDWYEACKPTPIEKDKDGFLLCQKSYNSGIYIAPEHIDLIANLVVERLKGEQHADNS